MSLTTVITVASLMDECDRLDAQLVVADTAADSYRTALQWLAHEMSTMGHGPDWYRIACSHVGITVDGDREDATRPDAE